MATIVFLNRPPFVIQNPLGPSLPEEGLCLIPLTPQATWGLHIEAGGPMGFG